MEEDFYQNLYEAELQQRVKEHAAKIGSLSLTQQFKYYSMLRVAEEANKETLLYLLSVALYNNIHVQEEITKLGQSLLETLPKLNEQ